jgi:glutamate-5-semialdehyde dehydrogenase
MNMSSIIEIGQRARRAGQTLASSTLEHRDAALQRIKEALSARTDELVAANRQDLAAAAASGLDESVTKVPP